MVMLAVVVGIYLVHRWAVRRGWDWADRLYELAIWLILGGVAGARVWEVAWSWDYYREHLWEIPQVWLGGLSIQGGILGGVLVALAWARVYRLPAWVLLDHLIPAVVLAQGIGRIGCLLSGDAYGIPVAQTWWPDWLGVRHAAGSPANLAFGDTPLVPAELLEGIADFAIAGFLVYYRRWPAFAGARTLAYAILYSLARLALEFWRGDSLVMPGGFKAAQVLALLTIAVAVALWAQLQSVARAAGAKGPPGMQG